MDVIKAGLPESVRARWRCELLIPRNVRKCLTRTVREDVPPSLLTIGFTCSNSHEPKNAYLESAFAMSDLCGKTTLKITHDMATTRLELPKAALGHQTDRDFRADFYVNTPFSYVFTLSCAWAGVRITLTSAGGSACIAITPLVRLQQVNRVLIN